MTKLLLRFLLIVLLFTSCKEEEDTIPQSELVGTYEISNEINDTGIWVVNQYIFKADGNIEQFGLMRDAEKGNKLGYTYHTKGSYTLNGVNFVIKMTEAFLVNYTKSPVGYADSVEDLESKKLSAESVEFKGVIQRSNSGAKISIVLQCTEIVGATPSDCIGERVFNRVD